MTMGKNRFVIYFRRGLLALFVVLITAVAYLQQVGGAMIPSIHFHKVKDVLK